MSKFHNKIDPSYNKNKAENPFKFEDIPLICYCRSKKPTNIRKCCKCNSYQHINCVYSYGDNYVCPKCANIKLNCICKKKIYSKPTIICSKCGKYSHCDCVGMLFNSKSPFICHCCSGTAIHPIINIEILDEPCFVEDSNEMLRNNELQNEKGFQ